MLRGVLYAKIQGECRCGRGAPGVRDVHSLLAEDSDGDGERLEFQKAFSFDEQDRLLGTDTYCLCTEMRTVYGGVTSWTLTGGTLEVRLDERAAQMLGVEGGFLVSFPPENLPAVREGLERVLG